MDETLQHLEKFHRRAVLSVPPRVTGGELFITAIVCFLTAPFLCSALFLIPIIGQILFFGVTLLILLYFFVRGSAIVVFTALGAFLLFAIPVLVAMENIRYRLDLPLFFLMAGCIPVSIFFGILVAARIWLLIELRHEEDALLREAVEKK